MSMLRTGPVALAVTLAGLAIGPAAGGSPPEHRREQDQAWAATRAGQAMPLSSIEARIVPRMRGADYLGPEYDAGSSTYRLKFMRDGSVIWIDVDARSGQVVGRSGY